MGRIVPVSEARATLGALLDEASEHEVYIVKRGRPQGVLLSVAAFQAGLDRIEDLEDRLSVLQAGDAVPFERSAPAEVSCVER